MIRSPLQIAASFRVAWCAVVLTLALAAPSFAQTTLDRLRSDVRAPRPARENSSSRSRDKSSDCDDDDSEGFVSSLLNGLLGGDDDDCNQSSTTNAADSNDDNVFGYLLVAGAVSPWAVPIGIAGDDYIQTSYDLPFPYVDNADGYLTVDPSPYIWPNWSLRSHVDYGTDFEHLSFISTRWLLESNSRWGVDSDVRYWHENLESGASDQLWTGDVNLVFRFARSEKFQMRTGLGSNWLADQQGSDFGFNFTHGGDWFPRKPWVVSGELDWGTIANSELFHVRSTVGLSLCPVELFTGYDYFDATSFRVHGLVGGLRVWF